MTLSGDSIEIAASPRKLLMVLLGALVFVLLGLWLLGVFGPPPVPRWRSRLVADVAGAASVGFFGLIAVIALFQLATPDRRGLWVDSLGFTDRSSVVAAGRVAWTDVVGLRVWQYQRTRTLCVYVRDPGPVLAAQPRLRRWLMTRSIKMLGTPVTITTTGLACDFDELCRAFEQHSGLHAGDGSGPH